MREGLTLSQLRAKVEACTALERQARGATAAHWRQARQRWQDRLRAAIAALDD